MSRPANSARRAEARARRRSSSVRIKDHALHRHRHRHRHAAVVVASRGVVRSFAIADQRLSSAKAASSRGRTCAQHAGEHERGLVLLGRGSTCGRRLAKRQLKPNKLPASATRCVHTQSRSPLFDHLIPDCQSKLVDCFYYCGVNRSSAWAAKGWQIRSPTLQNGTEFISAERLTAKYYKFVLPQELHDWVHLGR